jgi:hypothetical protein
MRSQIVYGAAVACCLATIVTAQQETRRIAAGTASIGGRVVDRDSERPLESAFVTLLTADSTGGAPTAFVVTLTGGVGLPVLKTVTDANGFYLFEGIAPGEYRVTAANDGYALEVYDSSDVHLGNPEVIRVGEGQAQRNVDFFLSRSGSISGHVATALGRLLKDAHVSAIPLTPSRSSMFATSRPAQTDERGAYTIHNVPPGLYRVQARWTDPEMRKAQAGMGGDVKFFPATDKSYEAAAVAVGAGEAVRGIDILLSPPERFRLSGQLVGGNSDGRIEAHLLTHGSVRTVNIARGGFFDIESLQPGRYVLSMRASGEDPEAASMSLDVVSDVTGLVVALTPTGRLTGRLITSDGQSVPGHGLQVAAILADEGKEIDPLPRDRVYVSEDGTFEFRGLFGERILRGDRIGQRAGSGPHSARQVGRPDVFDCVG